MKAHITICMISIVLLSASLALAEASQGVHVISDVPDQVISAPFAAGDIVPVTLSVSSNGEAAVFGVDLRLKVSTEDVRIHTVTFDPAFSATLGEAQGDLPGPMFRAVRVQPEDSLDRSLGANGQAVPFVTVELEVLNGTAFTSALKVRAKGALLGEKSEGTVIGDEEVEVGKFIGKARIEIINTNPPPAEPEGPPLFEAQQHEQSTVSLELRPIGGGEPVIELVPNTTYEVHYDAGADGATGYVLFGVTDSPDQTIIEAAPPPAGEWAGANEFAFVLHDGSADSAVPVIPAYGFADGYFRFAAVSDDLWTGPEPPEAPAQGHLCNITTGAEGELNLHLYLWLFDTYDQQLVTMENIATYPVTQP
jgi:hypothetical protein